MCGDVPDFDDLVEEQIRFSPRVRGCSRGYQATAPFAVVFPACAGMFRPFFWHG